MLLVLASTVAFLYYMTAQNADEASSGLNLLGGVEHSYEDSKSLSLEGIRVLDVSSVSAEVKLICGEVSQVEAHFYGTASFMKGSPEPELSVLSEGGTAKVMVEPRGGSSYRIYRSDLVLEVKVPSSFAGELLLRSVSGGISIGDLSATSLNADSVSGSITLGKANVTGALKVNSISGGIEAEAIEAESITLNSISGRIDPGRIWGSSSMKMDTISGSVVLEVPEGKGFKLRANSVSGNISFELPMSIEKSNSRNLIGTVGDGASLLDITTVSGSIDIGSY